MWAMFLVHQRFQPQAQHVPTMPSSKAAWASWTAYIEEMIAGQKVVKVFNHQKADLAEFAARNEKLRLAGTGAQSYAATMVPAVVSIGYINYAVIAAAGRPDGHEGHGPTWAAWPAIWCLCARPPCPSTSLPSRATSCWRRWPVPSVFLPPWSSRPKLTRAR